MNRLAISLVLLLLTFIGSQTHAGASSPKPLDPWQQAKVAAAETPPQKGVEKRFGILKSLQKEVGLQKRKLVDQQLAVFWKAENSGADLRKTNVSEEVPLFPQEPFGDEKDLSCRWTTLKQDPFYLYDVEHTNYRSEPGKGYRPFAIHAVCPCKELPRHWVFLDVACEMYLVKGQKHDVPSSCHQPMWSYGCRKIDPLLMINFPPLWIANTIPDPKGVPREQGALEKLILILQKEVRDGNLPRWPIYVEDNGKLRRAEKRDMKFVSKGIFKIPATN